MTKSAREKPFDCIEFKRRVQQEIYETIKDMTPEEEIEYFRHAVETGPFVDIVRATGAQGDQRKLDQTAAQSVPTRRT